MTDLNTIGLTRPQYWLLTLMGIAALAMIVLNIYMAIGNTGVRKEVNERQQFINQSVRLSRLHTQLINGLASLSARTGDEELREVLAKHGISFRINASAAPSLPVDPQDEPATGSGEVQE